MKKMVTATGIAPDSPPAPNIFEANKGRGLPKKTFKDTMTLGSGVDQIDLYYFGRGHTNGDAWVVFPALRVVHAGDVFSGKNLPLLDVNNGGSGVPIRDTARQGVTAALQGCRHDHHRSQHQMTMNDLKEYAEFNREFLKTVRAAMKAGKPIDEIAGS